MIIVHVITCLNDGGAEAVLYRLCLFDKKNTHVVISLQGEGKYGPMLMSKGISVYCLGLTRNMLMLHRIFKLIPLLKKIEPDVVQTWLYHADLMGGLVAKILGIKNICWGIRSADFDYGSIGKSTFFIVRLNALLSRWIPVYIISCSNKAVDTHASIGYAKNKFCVIRNGYDLHEFMPNLKEVAVLRDEQVGISKNSIVLGMVARFDPLKNHKLLVTALGLVSKRGYVFCCLLVGTGVSADNLELKKWLEQYRLHNRVLLMGQRTDIPSVMNLIDIHILSSSGEAFPNVLGEAMACGTPCVTTDVGDTAEIVGDTGWVVPAESAEALSDAIIKAIDEFYNEPDSWMKRRQNARERIKDNFGIEKMVKKYSQVWQSL
ncbi:MAG: glycosyltransferase [Candidatus Electrothrix sp. AR1]|nr:glycosyltransferase [Candidatus Electrothrix sp. AR1]